MHETSTLALRRAIEAAGSQERLASSLQLRSQSSISRWLKQGYPPAHHALRIEAVTGVSRHDLRPDLYPRETRTHQPDSAAA